jgi:peptide/nickel transport system substrate-binding protein
MVISSVRLLRAVVVGAVVALALAACGGASQAPSGGGSAGPSASGGGGQAGGKIVMLSTGEQFDQIDPQRAYTGEDLAFFGSTIYRGLVAYVASPDEATGLTLQPDVATDLGTHNDDATQWTFTLRDGVTWQDGSDVTCEDFKYGVSRTFATDVINQGPTYAISYLDIPFEADGQTSTYKGPYTGVGQDAFDQAVTCDGKTITFNLNRPIVDFNFTTTLGMFAVPNPTDHPGVDTGETYGVAAPPMSDGPYKIDSYTTGNGGKLIMSRNDKWDPASDTVRKAYPDTWEVDFLGGDAGAAIDQRLMQSSGADANAIGYAGVEPQDKAVIFTDAHTAASQYAGRAFSFLDIYVRYFWIDVNKVPNVKIRQAMAVALDRAAYRLNIGGAFAGDYADGLIKPNLGADVYAETGWATDLFGQAIPENGDPEFAKKLIQESGEPAPSLTFDFGDTPTNGKTAAIVIASLGKAGITVTPNPIESAQYYSVVFDPAKAHEFGTGGWGADWPNASTVIPPLLTEKGGWDLSKKDDAAFNAKVDAAGALLDITAQRKAWQDLNKESMLNVDVIPTFFGLAQDIGGSGIGNLYRWSAYGSWPYSELYVKP